MLERDDDTRLGILLYQQTNPLHPLHGLPGNRSPPQTHDGLHRVLPVVQHALRDVGHAPERDARRVVARPLTLESPPAVAIDGTERRRQRPQDAPRHKAHDSGTKTTPPDKNILLVNEHTGKVVSLGPTVTGHTHDKKAADAAQIADPANAMLDKETGVQGDDPDGVLTRQPHKTRRAMP